MTAATFRDYHHIGQERSVAYTVTYYLPSAPSTPLNSPAPQSVAAGAKPADVTGPNAIDELLAKGPEGELYTLVREGPPVSDRSSQATPTLADMTTAIAAAQAAGQPLDSDLTAIAALSTTSFGRALLADDQPTALAALKGAPVLSFGLVTLVAGTVDVANVNVTTGTRIRVFRQAAGGTLGNLSIVLDAGVKFTINSDNVADTSTVYYEVISY